MPGEVLVRGCSFRLELVEGGGDDAGEVLGCLEFLRGSSSWCREVPGGYITKKSI